MSRSAAAAWLVALATCLSPAASAGDEPDAPAAAAPAHPLAAGVGADLNRALRLARDRSVPDAKIVGAIVKLGAAAIAPSIVALDERKLPPIDGGKEQVLSERQEERLLDGLRRCDHGLVWQAIEARLLPRPPQNAAPSLSARAAAILCAGTCASGDELGRVLACGRHGGGPLEPALDRAACLAAGDVFRRNPDALSGLTNAWHSLPAAYLPAIVEGAGGTADPRALPFLEQMLGHGGDPERLALAALALQRAPGAAKPSLLEQLRHRLEPHDAAICQAACSALGVLGDFGCVEELALLLDGDSEGIRSNAHHALCTLSGLALPPQTAAWHAWYVRESIWYAESTPELAEAIAQGNARAARNALTELGLHRFERHALSDIAAAGLKRPELEVFTAACQTLAQLGSPRGRKPLQAALASDDPARTAAANTALAALADR